MFIRALPGTGKTWFANRNTGVLDTDDIIRELTGDVSDKHLKRMLETPELFDEAKRRIEAALADDGVVVSNFNPAPFGLTPDYHFGYEPDDYIRHLEIAGRNDLLTGFEPDQLKGWAAECVAADHYVKLQPGQYLAGAIASMRLH